MIDPFVGQVVNGKFRVIAPIGAGGMGKIYRAEQLPLGRAVALKVLRNRPGVTELDPAFQRRFFLEASLCAKLSHPNVVTIYDYGRIEGAEEEAYFMAMELLDGVTLHQRLRERGGILSPSEALSVTLEIARGLREAHKNGIVHRDLKPGNVMLVPNEEGTERVKILDFGLVKQVETADREDLTKEGSFLGSPKYMSPEQIDQAAGIDHRTDLYSLGVILYQALCGRVPFEHQSSMQILLMHVSAPVPPLKERNPLADVPPPVEALVRKLLEKNPANRHANADELIRELRGLQDLLGYGTRGTGSVTQSIVGKLPTEAIAPEPSGSLVGASLSGPRPNTVEPRRGGNRGLVIGLAAVGVLALVGGVGVAFAGRGDRGPATVAANNGAAQQRPEQRPEQRPAGAPAQRSTLHIESTPTGATVTEGGRVVGMTPLDVQLDESQTLTRQFVIQRDGYQPFVHAQAPTRESVRVVAALLPAQPAPQQAGQQPQQQQQPVAPQQQPVVQQPVGGGRPVIRRQNPRHQNTGNTGNSGQSPLDIRMQR